MKAASSMTCQEMLREMAVWDCVYRVPSPSVDDTSEDVFARVEDPRVKEVREALPERFLRLRDEYILRCLEQGNVGQFYEMLATYLKSVRCNFGDLTQSLFQHGAYKCGLYQHPLGDVTVFSRPRKLHPTSFLQVIKVLRTNPNLKEEDKKIIDALLSEFAEGKGHFTGQQRPQQRQGGGGAKKRAKVQHASQQQIGVPEPLWTPTALKPAAQQPPPLVQAAAAGGGGAASSAAAPRQQQQQQRQRQRQRQLAGKTDS